MIHTAAVLSSPQNFTSGPPYGQTDWTVEDSNATTTLPINPATYATYTLKTGGLAAGADIRLQSTGYTATQTSDNNNPVVDTCTSTGCVMPAGFAAVIAVAVLGLRQGGLTFVSCPSCGRADVDLVALAKACEDKLRGLNEEIHVAVMGCEVNGPGEARAADIGVAGGKGIGLIFRKGEVVRKVPEAQIVDAMWEEVESFIAERKAAEGAARP